MLVEKERLVLSRYAAQRVLSEFAFVAVDRTQGDDVMTGRPFTGCLAAGMKLSLATPFTK